MSSSLLYNLQEKLTPGAQVGEVGKDAIRLEIPAGLSQHYRLAQLDDYGSLPRSKFPWSPPLRLSLRARASSGNFPGTWGFGFWNDPFSMGVLSRSGGVHLPVLPNAAWFFSASQESHLALVDNLPACGWTATTFSSPLWSSWLSLLGLPVLPLLIFPPFVRFFRRLVSRKVYQAVYSLPTDPTEWSSYAINWKSEGVEFIVNDEVVFATSVVPRGRLGLVIWVDNQYASVPPSGRLRYGFLPNPDPVWIEIESLRVTPEKFGS